MFILRILVILGRELGKKEAEWPDPAGLHSRTLEAVGRAVTRRVCVNRVIRTHFSWECEDEMSSQCSHSTVTQSTHQTH